MALNVTAEICHFSKQPRGFNTFSFFDWVDWAREVPICCGSESAVLWIRDIMSSPPQSRISFFPCRNHSQRSGSDAQRFKILLWQPQTLYSLTQTQKWNGVIGWLTARSVRYLTVPLIIYSLQKAHGLTKLGLTCLIWWITRVCFRTKKRAQIKETSRV